MDTKRCGKCREFLPFTDFIPRRDKPDKYLPNCKACRGTKSGGLKRTPMNRGGSQMKRTQMKPISERRRRVNTERREAMIAHFGDPKKWTCQLAPLIGSPCFGEIHGHEILSRARAGRTDDNLLDMKNIRLACNFHNGWVEDYPEEAHELGLTRHSWE